MAQAPRTVFIIGPPRSGTTLLAYMLGGAPGVLSVSEPHLARAILPDWKFQRMIRRFQRENGLKRVHFPHARTDSGLRVALEALAATNSFETLSIKETYRTNVSRPSWDNAELMDELAASFPTILLIRHPYDVAASTVNLCRWATGWRGRLLRLRWRDLPLFADSNAVVRWAAQNWAAYGEWAVRCHRPLFRYEELVSDPPRVAEVCSVLGMRFDAAMLDYRRPRQAFGGIGDPGVMHKPPRPVDRSAIGRGAALTAMQRAVVREVCEKGATAHGYDLL
jgi:hypothetical protein